MIPVALLSCPDYDEVRLLECVDRFSREADLALRPGCKVLVKPNLVSARRANLSCTHPALVRAVCLYLLDHHVQVLVGDSPAFGSAPQVARAAGLTAALRDLPVPIVDLGSPVRHSLDCGVDIGISRTALDADMLINLPKLKAHSQLFITAAVKNLFGCVSGVRKAVAHMRHGQGDALAELIVDLPSHLPPTFSVLDAVTAMQRTGPVRSIPCALGLMAASPSALALDTGVYTAMGFTPEQVPLWRVAKARNLPGSQAKDLSYPATRPEDLDLASFEPPASLKPVSFHPWQMTKSMAKRAWLRLCR
jgi:uncharacterized protein (DUF362 family)